jgi:aminomethyltransferase
MSNTPLKRTVLYDEHAALGGKLIEFGGWEMPVQYSTIVDEHLCVRRSGGIFDIAHMGELFVRGPQAGAFLNAALTNNVAKLTPGLGQYTLMCKTDGGVVDDLYLYRLGAEDYLIILNASRIDADLAHLRGLHASKPDGVTLDDQCGKWGAIALQGPRVAEYIGKLFPGASAGGAPVAAITDLKKNQIGQWAFDGVNVWVGRTGYTGEDGFEAVAPAPLLPALWRRALTLGHTVCQQPAGLGARDTLRTEMGYPLYGHELDEATTPIEAGLGFFVSLDKGEFNGRAVLADQAANGVKKKLAAFKIVEKAPPPRPGYALWAGGKARGVAVSGTLSPSLQAGIGMGYLPPEFAVVGAPIEVEIRGRRFKAEVVKKPFYRKA